MSPIAIWIISYALPVLPIVGLKVHEQNVIIRMLYIHLFLTVSIALFALFGIFFLWSVSLYSLLTLGTSILIVAAILGWFGVAYVPSAFIQEWMLLIAGPLLAVEVPFFWAVMLTAIPFALAHKDNKQTWQDWSIMFIPYFLWAVITLYLYQWLHQPLYNVALHLLAGAILVRVGILFRNRNEAPWLFPQQSVL